MARFPRWRRCSRQHLPRGTARTRSWSGWRPRLGRELDRKSTRLNSSHEWISYAVFCLKKKKNANQEGAPKAAELGVYGPCQDLVADAFTGNLRGAGPATVALPLGVRQDNPSQTVVVAF